MTITAEEAKKRTTETRKRTIQSRQVDPFWIQKVDEEIETQTLLGSYEGALVGIPASEEDKLIDYLIGLGYNAYTTEFKDCINLYFNWHK